MTEKVLDSLVDLNFSLILYRSDWAGVTGLVSVGQFFPLSSFLSQEK